MRVFGSDRVRVDGERIILSTRVSKGWTPRTPKSLTHSEFPGTAVLWEEQYYEVVDAEGLPQGGVRYALEPWKESNAIRVADRYDEQAEAQRAAQRREDIARERGRMSANFLGLITGNLPAVVQNHLARELGIQPARLTMLSMLTGLLVIVLLGGYTIGKVMDREGIPLVPLVLIIYFAIEFAVRFLVVSTQGRPIGSSLGLFGYILYWGLSPNRARLVSPFAVEAGYEAPISEAPPDVAIRDQITLLEPLLTLLAVDDQHRLAARFGFDYRRQARATAGVILFFAAAGVASSIAALNMAATFGPVVALLVALGLGGEQLVRLVALRRGPAGSVLAALVRPLVRKLLA